MLALVESRRRQTASPAAPRPRLDNIQALRALAALLVVFVHLDPLARLAGWPARSMAFGHGGVDLFFVISGLVMVVTTAGRPTTPAAFLRDRLVRIAPLYWTITLLVFGVAVLAPSLMQTTRADPAQLLKSLAFVPYVRSDGLLQPVVFVGWTLNYEIAFYVVFALGLALRRRPVGLALVIGLLGLAAACGWALRPGSPRLAFYTSPLLVEFAAGMLLGLLWSALPRHPPRGAAAGATAVGAAALALMLAGPQLWPHASRPLMFGAPGAVLVACALVAERAGVAVRSPSIQALGAASYSIYLSHFFCTSLVVKVAERFAAPPLLAPLALTAFLLVILVGLAVHRWIERPLTRWVAEGVRTLSVGAHQLPRASRRSA